MKVHGQCKLSQALGSEVVAIFVYGAGNAQISEIQTLFLVAEGIT